MGKIGGKGLSGALAIPTRQPTNPGTSAALLAIARHHSSNAQARAVLGLELYLELYLELCLELSSKLRMQLMTRFIGQDVRPGEGPQQAQVPYQI